MLKIKIQHDVIEFCLKLLYNSIITNFLAIYYNFKIGEKYKYIKINRPSKHVSHVIYEDCTIDKVCGNDSVMIKCTNVIYKTKNDFLLDFWVNSEYITLENELYLSGNHGDSNHAVIYYEDILRIQK